MNKSMFYVLVLLIVAYTNALRFTDGGCANDCKANIMAKYW